MFILQIIPFLLVVLIGTFANDSEGVDPPVAVDKQPVADSPRAAEADPEIEFGPEVKTKSGTLKPMKKVSRNGMEYSSFRGVPFATPPKGKLRFLPPVKVRPWEGVRYAVEFAPPCFQWDLVTEELQGDEDCLYLNIFTPKVPEAMNKLPVIVFLHQGAFMFGDPSEYRGKYMMDQAVVLVTVAYRLGAFGFLNTQGDSDAHGNMGLKDQVLALQWIQENIEAFNGDPERVTLFGESAGGASVHYHILSPKSTGLFSRAIIISGTALSPWAYSKFPREEAVKLATSLNCPIEDFQALVACLRHQPPEDIAIQYPKQWEWWTDPLAPFGPSIEKTGDTIFLSDSPYNMMKAGAISNDDIPLLLGVDEGVCLQDAWSILLDPKTAAELNKNWNKIAPLTFDYFDTAENPDEVSDKIKAYYFGEEEPVGDSDEIHSNLTDLYSDRLFNHGHHTTALLHVKKNPATPIYLFTVAYVGEESQLKSLGIEEKLGVSEADELQYLFDIKTRFSEIGNGHPDEDFSEKFINLIVSFARDGEPNAGVWGPEWEKMTLPAGDEPLQVYQIDKECSMIDEPYGARMEFWDELNLYDDPVTE